MCMAYSTPNSGPFSKMMAALATTGTQGKKSGGPQAGSQLQALLGSFGGAGPKGGQPLGSAVRNPVARG